MTNDAKLGMLAGVLGVVIAAVFFTKPPPQPAPVAAEPTAKPQAPATPGAQPEAGLAALPSTPVPRTRKDVIAQPASRQPLSDEEP